MNKILYIGVALLIVILGFMIFGPSENEPGISSEVSNLFQEELTRAGVERIGQPIEGFTAFMYLDAFPGFEASDFDGVESFEGLYGVEDGGLVYTRTAGNPVTSAEETISSEGYETLLQQFSSRVGVSVETREDIPLVLEKLREADVEQDSYVHEDFSILLPERWYPYENGPGVLFVPDADLEIPLNTDSFAIGPYFQVSVHDMSVDELFTQNLWNEGSEFLVSRNDVRFGVDNAIRVVTNAAGAGGQVLHYVFESTDDRVFVLSHYPYEPTTPETDDFESVASSFMINYVFDGSGGGGAGGILPFKSGVRGVVLLGPTCPVEKIPPDPDCVDKGYQTTVQVIERNSEKSSLFSSVETDTEGAYQVMLPPGEYRLQALGGKPYPLCDWQDVTIEPDVMIDVDLSCDSGIR